MEGKLFAVGETQKAIGISFRKFKKKLFRLITGEFFS